jgi:ribonuclease VapC
VKQKRLLDSFAIIAYLNKDKGFEKVRDAMSEAQNSGGSILMNEINIGEVYYILFRKRGPEKADYFLQTILQSLPIIVVSNDFDDVIKAAKIKAEHPLSFADCFAAATAKKNNSVIMTGDPEFKKIEDLVAIEWLDT